MKINEINRRLEAIQKLYDSDADGAIGLLHDLLRQIMEDDIFYVLGSAQIQTLEKDSFLPYIAPIQNLPYLRYFTDQQAAEDFLKTAKEQYPIIQLDTISTIKLSKYWMLMGAEGFILNDGQKWTAVSFTQFLSIFLTDLLDEDGLFDEDYCHLVKLCSRLLNGEKLFYQKDGTIREEPSGEPISVENFALSNKPIQLDHIRTNGTRMKSVLEEMVSVRGEDSTLFLSTGDKIYSYAPDHPYPFQTLDPVLAVKKPAAEKDTKPSDTKLSIFPKIPKPDFLKLKTKLSSKMKKHSLRLWISLGAAAVLALFCIYAGSGFLAAMHFSSLCSDMEYQEAAVYYKDHGNPFFRMSADHSAENAVAEILSAYIQKDITAEEATASFSVLSTIPAASEVTGQAKNTVDLLEQSRVSYEAGENTDQVIERLYYWLDVVEQDEENFQAVQEDIQSNGSKYESRVLRIVDALIQNGQRGQAKWCLEILQQWFPKGEYQNRLSVMSDVDSVSMEITPVAELSDPQVSLNPIEIYDIDVSSPDGNGYVDLYIRWKNTGTKTIQEIIFYTVPIDDFGGVVSSNRDGGYSLYGARDIGPYKPGTGTPSENWAWENVWSNSQIEAAEVQQIIIFYQDGTVKSIEDPSRLIVS